MTGRMFTGSVATTPLFGASPAPLAQAQPMPEPEPPSEESSTRGAVLWLRYTASRPLLRTMPREHATLTSPLLQSRTA